MNQIKHFVLQKKNHLEPLDDPFKSCWIYFRQHHLVKKKSLDHIKDLRLVYDDMHIFSVIYCKSNHWFCVTEEKSPACVESTFEMTPSSGMLEAQVSFVSKNKALLKVFFEAK